MTVKARPAQNGRRTVYVEHGAWYDPGTKHIHVTIPGAEGAHWSYGRAHPLFAVYAAVLALYGRGPDDQMKETA